MFSKVLFGWAQMVLNGFCHIMHSCFCSGKFKKLSLEMWLPLQHCHTIFLSDLLTSVHYNVSYDHTDEVIKSKQRKLHQLV